jgi:polyamine oxidase
LQGDFSERIEVMEDDAVKLEVMSVLSAMFPGRDIPDPLDFYFPRWASDPLYRGSYSNWPSSFVSDHHDNLRATVDQRLWFAGEATSQKWFGGFIVIYPRSFSNCSHLADIIRIFAWCLL